MAAPRPPTRRARPRRSAHGAPGAPGTQLGLAFTAILIVLVAGSVAALLAFAAPLGSADAWDEVTRVALGQARAALIGRAATDDNRPGSLPCPDTNDDGDAELLAGNDCPSYIGRLPWRTLGVSDLRDSRGERLWYALSPSLRDDSVPPIPINSDTAVEINVIGAVPRTNVAAVVIAPGTALSGQNRDAAGRNNPINYLEGDNANADNVYETGIASQAFNDRVAVITRAQLFTVVEWRVAREIRVTLQNYFTTYGYFPFANDFATGTTGPFPCSNGQLRGRLPNPDNLNPDINATCGSNNDWGGGLSTPPPPWFFANGWHLLTYYALAPACTSADPDCSGSGFLALNGTGAKRALVIVGGGALSAQTRPCSVATACIEQPSAAIDQYQTLAVSSTFNDRLVEVEP